MCIAVSGQWWVELEDGGKKEKNILLYHVQKNIILSSMEHMSWLSNRYLGGVTSTRINVPTNVSF
jgi:hypothetical protein